MTANTTSTASLTTSTDKPCPFCTLAAGRVVQENKFAVLILDGYPVSPGHSLIIQERQVEPFFKVTLPVRAAMTRAPVCVQGFRWR